MSKRGEEWSGATHLSGIKQRHFLNIDIGQDLCKCAFKIKLDLDADEKQHLYGLASVPRKKCYGAPRKSDTPFPNSWKKQSAICIGWLKLQVIEII